MAVSLSEILQLDKTQASLKKIDLYLISQVKLSDEYMQALAYKAIILHTIGKSNDALKLLFPYVPDFKIMGHIAVIAVCDAIIEIYIDEFRFDQVEKYVNIKKNYLPMSKMSLFIKDKIKLFLAMNDTHRAKDALLDYLEDDLTKDEEIYAKEELSKIYYKEHQYDKFLELGESLEAYYQANLSIDKLALLDINRFKIAFSKGNYIKVVTEGNSFLDSASKPNHILSCAALVIKSYVALNDLKKAGIFESNYEEYVGEEYLHESLEFCDAALELYNKMNSLVSIRDYENRKKELEASLSPQEKKKKPKKKEDIIVSNVEPVISTPVVSRPVEDVIIPNITVLNPKIEESKHSTIVSTKTTSVKNVLVSEAFNNLASVFNAINDLNINVKFRELYRIALKNLCQKLPIDEVYLLYYKKSYLGLHYKKERAYDKRLTFEDIENTICYAAMEYDNEQFLDQSEHDFKKNIVTGEEYDDDTFAYSIPLHDSIQTIGSITYISKESFLDKEMVYESLKLISEMLNTRLLLSMKQEELEFNNKKVFFLKDKMSSGLKEEMDGYLHFSEQAMNILGVLEDITEADYLLHMKSSDIQEYRRIHEEIYTLLSENIEFEYDFNKNGKWIRVKERYYPMYLDGMISILSLIDDVTDMAKDKDDLIKLAYRNPISNMQTEVKLILDLEAEYPNRRLSLCVCELSDFDIYQELYGYNFGNQLIYAIGKALVEAFSNDFHVEVYHLESDRYVILFKNANDKRLIDSKLKKAFEQVSESLYRLNTRVNISFVAGVYRLGKNVKLDNPSIMLNYANEALYDAVDMKQEGHNISHYDGELSKARFNRNALISHISEAIDSNLLGLTYQQIVNLKTVDVYGYNVKLNLDNYEVDYNYMDMVITRRGLTKRVERYTLMNVFKELKLLYDNVKGYIDCFVYVSPQTIDETFYDFVLTQLNFFKINPEHVIIQSSTTNNIALQKLREKGFKLCSHDILDLYRNSCDYFMYDYHRVGEESIKEIRELCEAHNAICILGGMNNINDIQMAKDNNYDLIFGNYYKKAIRMKSLIERIKRN